MDSQAIAVEYSIKSKSEGRGFKPFPMLDGSGVKAMPGKGLLVPGSLPR